MPDASHDKLSYSKGALEKIRAKYDKLTREQLVDLVCEITRVYVVEQTIPYDIPIPERTEEGREAADDNRPAERLPDDLGEEEREAERPSRAPAHERFAQIVSAIKKRAALPQLEHFTLEEGKVVLRVDNQKVTFGERTTVEFVPSQGRPRRPSGERAAVTEGEGPATPAPMPRGAPGVSAPAALPAPAPAAPSPAPAPAARGGGAGGSGGDEVLPGARQGLPGGDGRTRQGSSAPFGAPPPPAPARGPGAARPPAPPAKPAGEKDKTKGEDSDVGHIVERFKRLDLD